MKQRQDGQQESNQAELIEITEELRAAQEEAVRKDRHWKQMMEKEGEPTKQNFRDYDQSQVYFVPVRLDNFLETEHPARVIDIIVERMDLSKLYEGYSDEGNPSYHPKMMLKVLFYAYYRGVMSCRQIWDALEFRSDFIFLSAGQVPNFRTVNSFRLRHLDLLPELFTQIVFLCVKLDMVDFQYLAVDGQKIHANASFRKSKNLKGLKKEYAKVQEGIIKLVEKEVSEEFPKGLKQKRLKRLEQKAEKLGEFALKLKELDDEDKRTNMIDEDAPVMKHKDGRSLPSYNHQSASDLKYGVVCAARTTQNSDLPGDLLPIVDDAGENTGQAHKNIAGDCGFCDYNVLEKIEEEREEEFYIPDRLYETSKKNEAGKAEYTLDRFTRNEDGSVICPEGHEMEHKRTVKYLDGHYVDVYEGMACQECPFHDRCTKGKKRRISIDSRENYRTIMREKLSSDEGREIYMKRQGLAEPLHGDDQKNKGWRQHHLRGFAKAAGEFLLIRIATNIGKIVRYRSSEVLAMALT